MEKEIICLETSPKKGFFACLNEGFLEFFKNIVPVLKVIWMPLLWFILTMLSLFMSTSSLKAGASQNRPELMIIGLILAIFAIVAIAILFWKSLKGIIAISYLAKDIYEHREIQSAKEYYSYIEKHTKEYIYFLLIVTLIGIVWIIPPCIAAFYLYGYSKNILILLLVAYFLLSIPFLIGLNFISFVSFAFEDKTKPLSLIKESIIISYKKFIQIFCFYLIFLIIGFIVGLIPILGAILGLMTLFLEFFVLTRYYFELKK